MFGQALAIAKGDDRSDLERLLDAQEPAVKRLFLELVDDIRDELTVRRIRKAIEEGRMSDAMRRATEYARLGEGVGDASRIGAVQTAQSLRDIDKQIAFDASGEHYAARIRAQRLELTGRVSEQQRQTIAGSLQRGLALRENPIAIARRFRDSIGLSPRQDIAVENYRRALETGDRAALERMLRDRRYDPSVRRMLETGEALGKERIDRMVERYRQRQLKWRAEMIARTEVLRALHEGQEEMLLQAIGQGRIDPASVVRIWHTRVDGRERASHRAMSGQTRALGEAFESGYGNLLAYPGDPDAPASEIIHCRCGLSFEAAPPQVP